MLLALAIFCALPFGWLILASVDPMAGLYLELPQRIGLDNFIRVFTRADSATLLFNSLVMAGGAVALVLFVCTLAGYALSRFEFRGRRALLFGILLTQLGLILGVQLLPQEEIDVTAFQGLMIVLTMTGLIAGALVNQHRRTEFQLRLHQDSLARLARLGSMGELAAAVAHEINQPLTAAGTYARLVATTLRSDKNDTLTVVTAEKTATEVERAQRRAAANSLDAVLKWQTPKEPS
jgi:signal transduction histidine kinase